MKKRLGEKGKWGERRKGILGVLEIVERVGECKKERVIGMTEEIGWREKEEKGGIKGYSWDGTMIED